MQKIEGFEFFPLDYDGDGALQSGQEFDLLIDRARKERATDAIFIAHGFRNDVADATGLYTRFLKTFKTHLALPQFKSIADRRFVVAGIYWPSKRFREVSDGDAGTRGIQNPADAIRTAKAHLEELKQDASPAERTKLEKAIELLPTLERNPKKQDEFVALVLSLLDRSKLDETEGLPQIRRRSGSELLNRLAPAPAADIESHRAGGTTRGLGDAFGTIAGGVGQFLNLTTWYVMKDRSGTVGAKGVASSVRKLHAQLPAVRIHLVGHSLGGRLMASCAKALCETPSLQPDSLMLLEAAFSHYGFSADNGHGVPGFFRDVIAKKIVKGPFVSTFSAQDTVVGKAYSIMSRLAGDNTRDLGDAKDQFGGIGRNGPLLTKEVATSALRSSGTAYDYKRGIINNLDGSGGLITNHSDVTNAAVTFAFASAIAQT
jgi:hypothetical protein